MKEPYSFAELGKIDRELRPTLEISLNPLGRVCASSRAQEGFDATHYDAVWVRDSLWAYLALRLKDPKKAKRILLGLVEYFGTPAQRARLGIVIQNPAITSDPDGSMQALHIRFDGKSPVFDDVKTGGQAQAWNHKQNDALGLFYQCVWDALESQAIQPGEIAGDSWEALLRLPTYWEKIRFEQWEDAGAWEEIERINTSSIALVTSALERAWRLATQPKWSELFLREASSRHLDLDEESFFNGQMQGLIERGYGALRGQLPYESPEYPVASLKHRKADAALLCLIYPCRLALKLEEKVSVLECVSTLVREKGVIRYVGDAYQSANYWRAPVSACESDTRTDDCSTETAFAARTRAMVPGTEAQWFFDSWMSHCFGLLYQQTADSRWYHKQTWHFERALDQITGPGAVGADGKPVPQSSLPESYNTLIDGNWTRLVPSPITPLNWSKACLSLALEALRESVRLGVS